MEDEVKRVCKPGYSKNDTDCYDHQGDPLAYFQYTLKTKIKNFNLFFWNRIKPGAGEYTGSAARSVGKSLMPNDGGDGTHGLFTEREVKMVGYWPSSLLRVLICISQIQMRPAPSPGPLRSICPPCQSRH